MVSITTNEMDIKVRISMRKLKSKSAGDNIGMMVEPSKEEMLDVKVTEVATRC